MCSPLPTSINITWDLDRNANSWALHQIYLIKTFLQEEVAGDSEAWSSLITLNWSIRGRHTAEEEIIRHWQGLGSKLHRWYGNIDEVTDLFWAPIFVSWIKLGINWVMNVSRNWQTGEEGKKCSDGKSTWKISKESRKAECVAGTLEFQGFWYKRDQVREHDNREVAESRPSCSEKTNL